MDQSTSLTQRRLIVTADDFGLTSEINAGIIEAHTRGILGSTALLMNGTATDEALRLIPQYPKLEVGIHLGIVEGYALGGRANSLTDELRYFDPERLCLHRAWPRFLLRYLTGRIRLSELEAELDLQLSRMREALGKIPFANGTQHLHLLPGVTEIVLRLLRKHHVPSLRLPARSRCVPGSWRRRHYNMALSLLGHRASQQAQTAGISTAKYFAGFDVCGRLGTVTLAKLLQAMPNGTMELMTHPGLDCPYLREHLAEGYKDFGWAGELAALVAPGTAATIKLQGIELIQFKDLPNLSYE